MDLDKLDAYTKEWPQTLNHHFGKELPPLVNQGKMDFYYENDNLF